MIYNIGSIPREFFYEDKLLSSFLNQEGDIGAFWNMVCAKFCDYELLNIFNRTLELSILAHLHEYPEATLQLWHNVGECEVHTVYDWEIIPMLLSSILCSINGISESFCEKLVRTAYRRQAEYNTFKEEEWNMVLHNYKQINDFIKKQGYLKIDLRPQPDEFIIELNLVDHQYIWKEITNSYNYKEIDTIISCMHSKDLRLRILNDINRERHEFYTLNPTFEFL